MNSRPWRDIFDLPEIDWPDWETRFSTPSGEVRRTASTPLAPPPPDDPVAGWKHSKASKGIGRITPLEK